MSLRSIGALTLMAGVITVPTIAGAPTSIAAPAMAAAPANPTTISLMDPVGLPLGDPPAAAYITGIRGGPIYRSGEDPLDVGPDGGAQSLLARARGGYLVTMDSRTVRFVSDTGAHHEVFAVPASATTYIRDVATSHDGRLAAVSLAVLSTHRTTQRVVVRRIAHPETIARRTFTDPVTVASLTAHRALLTPGPQHHVRGVRQVSTRWWSLRSDRLRTLDASGRIGPASDFGGLSAADLSAGQLAIVRGDHDRVIPLRPGAGGPWSTSAHEWVRSWSPDDRYVLTIGWAPQRPRTGHAWDTVSVRRASDGRLISTFTGFQSLSPGTLRTWQSSSTVLINAWDTCDHGSCANMHNVRCAVRGPCEQVQISGLPVGVGSVTETRRPSS